MLLSQLRPVPRLPRLHLLSKFLVQLHVPPRLVRNVEARTGRLTRARSGSPEIQYTSSTFRSLIATCCCTPNLLLVANRCDARRCARTTGRRFSKGNTFKDSPLESTGSRVERRTGLERRTVRRKYASDFPATNPGKRDGAIRLKLNEETSARYTNRRPMVPARNFRSTKDLENCTMSLEYTHLTLQSLASEDRLLRPWVSYPRKFSRLSLRAKAPTILLFFFFFF